MAARRRFVLIGIAPSKTVRALQGKANRRKTGDLFGVATKTGLLFVTYLPVKKTSLATAEAAVAAFIGKHADAVTVVGFTEAKK